MRSSMIGNCMRVRFVDRFRNHLFRSARACGPVRRKLEHGRRDYPRPLRTNPDWPWNKPQPNLFDWWFLRFLPNSVERARFGLRAGPDECSGWPAHRPWDRTVQSVSGQRDVDRYWAFRSLLGRLDRRPEDETFVVETKKRYSAPTICALIGRGGAHVANIGYMSLSPAQWQGRWTLKPLSRARANRGWATG